MVLFVFFWEIEMFVSFQSTNEEWYGMRGGWGDEEMGADNEKQKKSRK